MRTKKPKLLEAKRITDAFLTYKYTDEELKEMYRTLRARVYTKRKSKSKSKGVKPVTKTSPPKKELEGFQIGDLVEISDYVRQVKWLGVQGKIVGFGRTRVRLQITKPSCDFPSLQVGIVTTAQPRMLSLLQRGEKVVAKKAKAKPERSKLDILFE